MNSFSNESDNKNAIDEEVNLKVKVENPSAVVNQKSSNTSFQSATSNQSTPSLEVKVDMNNNHKIVRENSFVEPLVQNPFVHYLKLSLLDKIQVNTLSFFCN